MNTMDTVINKLRNTVSTVTSTVSQLSVVLPGNPVTREYEVNNLISSGGPGLLWKIYSGYKKSTKQEASIFVFEKRQLAGWTKKDREAMMILVKKGVNQLTKLRHPRFLTVQHPLEDSRDTLAFATEPVFASLSNVLGYNGNIPELNRPEIKDYKLHEIEIKYGLLQICDGLTFLHADVKMIHGNICPDSIIINQQGAWKIFGLDFGISTGTDETNCSVREYAQDMYHLTQQNLDYLAPEYTNSLTCCSASDMFSVGLLAYTAFSGGKPIVENCGSYTSHKQSISTFNSTISDTKLSFIPPEMRNFERRILSYSPSSRPDFHEFSKFEFFHDESVKTLNYLDSLFQWDNLQKSKFYKGLSDILPKLPQRVRVHRVVPCLAQEFVNPTMVPFVLPNVLKIAEWSTNEEYVQHILPFLKDVMKLREPVQILFIFMKYMELLLQKTPPEITKTDVLPLIYGSLESDSVQVQELCLSIIPSFAALIDYPAMKNSLLPRIRKLCISTPNLSVRVNCLVSLGKILDHLDKWLVMDFVLPFLMEIPSREPAVIMGIIGIYRLAVTHRKLGVTKEVIATKILPFIFPLTIENGLTTQQFSTIMNFVHEMISTVEAEHKAKLEEVGAIAKEREQMKAELNNHSEFSALDNASVDTNMFGGLSLNSNVSQNKNVSLNSSNTYGRSLGMGDSLIANPSPQVNNILTPSSNNKPMNNVGTKTSNMQPRDLTSTLMETNLKQMGGPTPIGMSMSTSASMPAMNMTAIRPTTAVFNNNPPMNQTAYNMSYFPANNVPFNTTGGTMKPILPNTNYNIMQPNPRPMNPQQDVKILTQRDIDDFLQ